MRESLVLDVPAAHATVLCLRALNPFLLEDNNLFHHRDSKLHNQPAKLLFHPEASDHHI